MAQRHGQSTKVPSLVLGCEKSNPSVHKNYSMLYSSHISWSSPTTPTPLELYPALAFDRLFKDEVQKGDKSVLDAVLADATTFADRSARPTSASSTNTWIRFARSSSASSRPARSGELQGWRPTLDKPNIPRPADGIPQDIGEHMRLMCDILVLGFQTDTTRVCTLKLNNDHSSLRFPHLGVDYMIHHLLSHSDTADWLKVNQFFLRAAGLHRPQARRDPGRRAHGARQLDAPVLLQHADRRPRRHETAGGRCWAAAAARSEAAGCSITWTSRTARCAACYLSMMDKCGIRLKEFGDSNERLAEV